MFPCDFVDIFPISGAWAVPKRIFRDSPLGAGASVSFLPSELGVNKILSGKERNFNDRFTQLCSHYPFDPVACPQAAGWEKGQVENQVKIVRQRFFLARPELKDFAGPNGLLLIRCMGWAKTHRHPTICEKTIWEVFEEKRPHLIKLQLPFDGYAERPARVSPSSLVTFDRNR